MLEARLRKFLTDHMTRRSPPQCKVILCSAHCCRSTSTPTHFQHKMSLPTPLADEAKMLTEALSVVKIQTQQMKRFLVSS